MKIIELVILIAVFVATVSYGSFILFQTEELLVSGMLHVKAVKLVSSRLDDISQDTEHYFNDFKETSSTSTINNMTVNERISNIDNFTKEIKVTATYLYKKRVIPVSVSKIIVDTRESEGQSSCRPVQDKASWAYPDVYSVRLSMASGITPTGLVLRGDRVYISSDSAKASDPDLYIFSIDHESQDLRLLSSLHTGPGASGLVVTDDYIYLANTSINAQLQVLSFDPRNDSVTLVSSYKLPGVYTDGTTIGNSIFYKKDYVFLGTQKSSIEELHVISVKSKTAPQHVASYEIGAGINDLFYLKDRLYVVSPAAIEIKMFSFKNDRLQLIDGHDASGSANNGKKVSVFLDRVFLGLTTGSRELQVLKISGSDLDEMYYHNTFLSVHGLIVYGKLLFAAYNSYTDGFRVFEFSSTRLDGVSANRIPFQRPPFAMSCDQSVFAIVDGSTTSYITFIKPSL